jgi:cytochrome c-type biogenesis protein CcmH
MINFFLGTGLMTLLLLVIILIPLLRRPRKIRVEAAPQASLAVYRDQFKELEDELARGAITQKEYDEGRNELERRVLEDSAPTLQLPEKESKAGVYTAIMLVLLVPLFAAFLWIVTQPIGDFRMDGGKYEGVTAYDMGNGASAANANTAEGDGGMHDMEAAIAKLQSHLMQNPGDLDGWVLLGRTLLTTRQYSMAMQSFEKANQLAPGNPAIMVDLADAIAMLQGQDLSGRPWELIQRALRIDPTNWKALAMAGTDKFNHQDYRQAVMYWERLLKVLTPGDGMMEGVKASIQEARELGKIVGPVQDTLDFSAGSEPAREAPPAMMRQSMQPLGASRVPATPVDQGKPMQVTHRISGVVNISPKLLEKAEDRSVLYITVRPADGSRTPIVQHRISVLDFPVHFTVDNTMVPPMNMGAAPLGEYKEVKVTARLSKENSMMPRSGDLIGESAAVKVGADDVGITLDGIR